MVIGELQAPSAPRYNIVSIAPSPGESVLAQPLARAYLRQRRAQLASTCQVDVPSGQVDTHRRSTAAPQKGLALSPTESVDGETEESHGS